jgi:ankyrin repeat protein
MTGTGSSTPVTPRASTAYPVGLNVQTPDQCSSKASSEVILNRALDYMSVLSFGNRSDKPDLRAFVKVCYGEEASSSHKFLLKFWQNAPKPDRNPQSFFSLSSLLPFSKSDSRMSYVLAGLLYISVEGHVSARGFGSFNQEGFCGFLARHLGKDIKEVRRLVRNREGMISIDDRGVTVRDIEPGAHPIRFTHADLSPERMLPPLVGPDESAEDDASGASTSGTDPETRQVTTGDVQSPAPRTPLYHCIGNFPDELLLKIGSYLPSQDRPQAAQVSRTMDRALSDLTGKDASVADRIRKRATDAKTPDQVRHLLQLHAGDDHNAITTQPDDAVMARLEKAVMAELDDALTARQDPAIMAALLASLATRLDVFDDKERTVWRNRIMDATRALTPDLRMPPLTTLVDALTRSKPLAHNTFTQTTYANAQPFCRWIELTEMIQQVPNETSRAGLFGKFVDIRDLAGRTALMVAADLSKTEIVKALLDAGASPDATSAPAVSEWRFGRPQEPSPGGEGWTALMFASAAGDLEAVEALLAAGAHLEARSSRGSNPLILTSRTGNLEIVSRLLEAGASVNDESKLGLTALMTAALLGHLPVVEKLLEHDADVAMRNSETYARRGKVPSNWTALMFATNGHRATRERYTGNERYTSIVLKLVNRDTVNELAPRSSHKTGFASSPVTPLIAACLQRDVQAVETLINVHGANVDARDHEGMTALMHVSSKGNLELAIALVHEYKADVNARDHEGMTALMHASSKGRYEVAQALIASGADVNAKDKKGKTVLDHASNPTSRARLEEAFQESRAGIATRS